jgi:hypothetical protein
VSKVTGFRWMQECNDEPAIVLAAVENMLTHLNTLPKGSYHVRRWPIVERYPQFEKATMTAIISCRFTLIEVDPPVTERPFGFGRDDGRGIG